MRQPVFSIVYYSATDHLASIAAVISGQLASLGATVQVLDVTGARDNIHHLHQSDLILFGATSHFGNISSGFQQFMEFTTGFWYQQPWKDKLAAGFTISSGCSDDKLHVLTGLCLFAAQHSMIWVSQGVLPRFINGEQTDGQNRLASYLGFMAQCGINEQCTGFHAGDILTAELFAQRLYDITVLFKTGPAGRPHERSH